MTDQYKYINQKVTSKGLEIESIEFKGITTGNFGREGGWSVKLHSSTLNLKNVKVPHKVQGKIVNGVIRCFTTAELNAIIDAYPNDMKHCCGYDSMNVSCPNRFNCYWNDQFFARAAADELDKNAPGFCRDAPFDKSGCKSFKSNK